MPLSPDREQQVKTTKERYGDDFYKKNGRKGGKNNKTNTPEKARMAANVRWERYRERQRRKEEKNDQS